MRLKKQLTRNGQKLANASIMVDDTLTVEELDAFLEEIVEELLTNAAKERP